MTRLTRGEIAVVADRLRLYDCLHEVVSEEHPEMGADLDDVINACDTTIAELEELTLEQVDMGLTKLQRFCLIDAVEGATVLAKYERGEPGYLSTRRSCRSAARKLSDAIGVEIAFPDR